MKTFHFTLTKRNITFLCICLGGLTLLFLISIVPLIAQEKELTQKIPELEVQISDQTQLANLLRAIDTKLATLAAMDNLPTVEKESLTLIESSSVKSLITKLAKEKNVLMIQIEPIIPESSENLTKLTFESDFQGSLTDIRSFVFSLLQIPYIDIIDELQIKSNDNILDLELVFSVRLT